MDEESIAESSGLTGNWTGPKLASEADAEDIDFDKIVDVDADDEDDDDSDSEEFDVQLSPSDERLLEELLRLKLTSLPATATGNNPAGSNPGDLSSNSAVTASAASLLPLSKNRGLFQPRSKLEQFEDIIFESQLLEAALPELEGKSNALENRDGFFLRLRAKVCGVMLQHSCKNTRSIT